MGKTVEEIRSYIANTPAPRLSERSMNAFLPKESALRALMEIADKHGQFDAIALALQYGRSIGYRMGRREAQLARGGEREA